MPYTKTVWVDRSVEKPRTFTEVVNGDGSITLTPSEGTVIATGTPVNASNMNKLETGVESAQSAAESANASLADITTKQTKNSFRNLMNIRLRA